MNHAIQLLFCICVFVNGVSVAQDSFLTISGKIIDAESHEPIQYANIQLKSKAIGTASNSEGEFVFKIPKTQMNDTLLISCVGYKTMSRPVGNTAGSSLLIRLLPSVFLLGEVVVTAETGLDFLKKVVARIPTNYDTSATQLTAFYRENIWLGDFELSFTEAVLDIHKIFKVEKKKPNDEIRVIKGRKKQIDFGRDGQFYYWMSGVSNGARGSLADDLVKYHNAKFSPLSPRNFKYYRYEFGGMIRDGDRNLVVLDVLPKKNARKGIIVLKLFIEEESLAIVKYDYHLSEAGVEHVSRKDNGVAYFIMSKVVKATRDYDKFEGTHTYKKLNSKWYLSAVKRHWEILVSSKKRDMVDRLWTADMDLIVTDINANAVKPIATENIGDNKSSMATLIGNNYDPEFWENFNILKPVIADSIRSGTMIELKSEPQANQKRFSNRQQGFTRADTLRGKLTPLRTCYDVTFYHLDVAIDLGNRSLKGSNLIRFDVITPFRKMQIDLYENMKIDKILYNGQHLLYTREFNAVFIDFPSEIRPGTQHELKIYYDGVPKTPDWNIPMNGGVLWDKDSVGNPWAQMVCQGSGASVWWPNKDHQSDEPDSMKIWITVPSEYTEISNGRLIRKTPIAKNMTRYEWFVSYPINNYNVTFNIGKYVHFKDEYISDDTLSIDYYVMPYNLERSKKMFEQVKPMLKCFEDNFGKYPFKRDGFTILESIYPMEHQSGVCIGRINAENASDTNPLLWHESAHEWWGNAITTKDIADMWIHEAFATYAEYQVIEDRFGKELAYQAIQEQIEAVENAQPVIGVYDVNHIFYDIGDMYSKGSLILHTFRNVLNNDTLWVTLLRDIQNEFRYKTISSNQLIAFISQLTQNDFTYFFDQYLKFTKLPQLEIELEENEENLKVRYRWVADVADFRMPIKVTTSLDHFDFIYPTTAWKTMTLKNLGAHEFDVNDEDFFIEIDIH